MKKPWTIRGAGRGSLEILLYSEIGESLFGEGTSAKQFAEDLAAAGPGITRISLRVNSPGGSAFDGMAIYATLRQHPAIISAVVEGLAASIASVVIMAAEQITMAPGSLLMIHDPYAAVLGGNAEDMRTMASALDRMKEGMVSAYRRHTDLSAKEVSDMMTAETWMGAQEAVDSGFADRVLDPDEDTDTADLAANFSAPIFAKFRNVPAQIAARMRSASRAAADAAAAGAESERLRLAARLELLKRL